MFGGSASPPKDKVDSPTPSPTSAGLSASKSGAADGVVSGREKRESSPPKQSNSTGSASKEDKQKKEGSGGGEALKRRASSVSRAAALFASAKNSLNLSSLRDSLKEQQQPQTPIQSLRNMDPALAVPQGPHNNSAGESLPTAHSSFRVGVTEDRNKKCRRTMEDTHAYLYNFLGNPVPANVEGSPELNASEDPASSDDATQKMIETDNGYFAIFDGHAGTFAAEWCGKKLHLILEDIFRKNPDAPVPELLDEAFTSVDHHLEKLPLKNSGCTAIAAVLRWEDRRSIPPANTTGGTDEEQEQKNNSETSSPTKPKPPGANDTTSPTSGDPPNTTRSRILYTANVGDARIILCRKGKALRLSYDHKGSDENEGRRITSAGGLILNNRVNGVLAVTRALGDSYMKDLVTGHPYTTETVIQPEEDEFLILACDGLWDVCTDQEAVDLIHGIHDPQAASKFLVDHALSRFSTDNLSIMVVRLDTKATSDALKEPQHPPVDPSSDADPSKNPQGVSEADKIVETARRNASESDEATEDEAGAQAAFFARARDQEVEDTGPEISLPNAQARGEDQPMSSPTGPDKTSNPG